jgi:hypothetical protein
MTLLYKKITVTKSKEVQTRSNLAGLLRKAMAQKVPFLPTMTTVVVVVVVVVVVAAVAVMIIHPLPHASSWHIVLN